MGKLLSEIFHTDKVLEYKRHVAYYLYVERGLSANHTGKEIGISQTSVSKWVKKFRWDTERLKQLDQHGKPKLSYLSASAQSIDDLQVYLQIMHPELLSAIDKAITQYRKLKGDIQNENR